MKLTPAAMRLLALHKEWTSEKLATKVVVLLSSFGKN